MPQEIVLTPAGGPAMHWLMGNFGVTPCGIAQTSPSEPPTTKNYKEISCPRCLEFAAGSEEGIYKCTHCNRFWDDEEFRDLHELSHLD